jgi:hypothetical protein
MHPSITIAGILMGLLLVVTVNSAQALELGMPDITMNSESGPVGSMITINVSNLPMPPDGADPRLEFYMYLPASDEYSSTLTSCDGYCIVLYSFDDIRNDQIEPKEITFALHSVKNPDPTSVQLSEYNIHYETKVGAVVNSICDVVINDKIEYKFGYSCNNYDVPVGEYDISFGWTINNSDVNDERQTITFTVTDEPYQFKGISDNVIGITSENMVGVSTNMILQQFQQNKMIKTAFVTSLENQGFSDKDIRRMLALSRSLEHQLQDESFGTKISKKSTMFGEVTGMLSDNTEVKIHRSAYVKDNISKLTVMFEKSKYVNYDIVVTQNGKTVLDDIGVYSMYGNSVHSVPVLSPIDPFDITVTFQGYGVGDGKAGPIGEQVVYANVVVNGVIVVHDSQGLTNVSTEQSNRLPIAG